MREESIISRIVSAARRNFPSLVFLILTLFLFSNLVSLEVTLDNIHHINDMTFQTEMIRQSLHEGQGFPLWTPYFYGGSPFFAIAEYYIISLALPTILIFDSITLSLNLLVLVSFFLCGLGMYLLVYRFLQDRPAALAAGIVYMLNGFMLEFILRGHPNMNESYAIIPFILLLLDTSIESKEGWWLPAIGAGTLLAAMILMGGMIFFFYTILIVCLFLFWSCLPPKTVKKAKKAFLIGGIMLGVCLGLSAFKLLPSIGFVEMSSRASGVSYSEFLGKPLGLSDLPGTLSGYKDDTPIGAGIGIMGLVIAGVGLMMWRKKVVILSALIVLLGVALSTATPPFPQLFSSLPGFGQMRHLERAIILAIVGAPILIGYGIANTRHILRRILPTRGARVLILALIAMMTFELLVLAPDTKIQEVVSPEEVPLIADIAQREPPFKVVNLGLSTPIGASGYNYYSQLKIPSLKGGGGIWVPEYAQYLAIAQQNSPAKLYGLLGAKYIVSDRIIDSEYLVLRDEFPSCMECPIWEAYGPYLYENMVAITSPTHISKAILVIGSQQKRTNLLYSLLTKIIDPKSTALIDGGSSLQGYSTQELTRFAGVILTDAPDQESLEKLREYQDNGGKIMPNIFERQEALTEEAVSWLRATSQEVDDIKGSMASFNSYTIKASGMDGWVYIPERFAHFPGWGAKSSGEEVERELPLYKSNIVGTALYINKGDQIELSYSPSSFKWGLLISGSTLIMIVMTWIVRLRRL